MWILQGRVLQLVQAQQNALMAQGVLPQGASPSQSVLFRALPAAQQQSQMAFALQQQAQQAQQQQGWLQQSPLAPHLSSGEAPGTGTPGTGGTGGGGFAGQGSVGEGSVSSQLNSLAAPFVTTEQKMQVSTFGHEPLRLALPTSRFCLPSYLMYDGCSIGP